MALLSALVPVVVLSERTLVNTGSQESIAHWRNNQVPDQGIDLSYCLSNAATEGVIARMTQDDHAAQLAFTAARVEQEKIVQAQSNYGLPLCVLGLIDAGLGR